MMKISKENYSRLKSFGVIVGVVSYFAGVIIDIIYKSSFYFFLSCFLAWFINYGLIGWVLIKFIDEEDGVS